MEKMAIPEARFLHVHMNLVGPLPVEGGLRLTIHLGGQVRFCMPAHITSDRFTQFTCSTWRICCKQQGIQHHNTTAFHPQANGIVERFPRQLKDDLHARGASTT